MPLQAVEPRRLYRQIAAQITELIASGEFPPGARLPAERDLASSLGVSRASVREAIISLEIGGLVEVRVGTGIFVTSPAAPSQATRDAGPGPFELLQARKLIEGEIAAVAATKASQPDLDLLRQSLQRMEAHVEDFAVREASDREFHLGIAKVVGSSAESLSYAGAGAQDDPRSRRHSRCHLRARSGRGARGDASPPDTGGARIPARPRRWHAPDGAPARGIAAERTAGAGVNVNFAIRAAPRRRARRFDHGWLESAVGYAVT